jgi:GH25 family lysozyme M1 (1,4-beta-N-acetylmuramidase)
MGETLLTSNVIDIYHGNAIHDFAELKSAGVLGIIHKCTQGAGYADPMYATRRKLVTDAGLLWGAYSFNTGESVSAQVKEFLSHAELDNSTLMALDFEDNPHSQMSLDQARLWLQQIEAATGRKAILYSGNRVKDLLGANIDSYLGSHRLWLAQYGPTAHVQASWSKPWLWQYSESGRLPGTDGAIDFNYYAGTQLAQEWVS